MRIEFHTSERVLEGRSAEAPSAYFVNIRAELVDDGEYGEEDRDEVGEVIGHARACVFRHECAEARGVGLFEIGDTEQDKHNAWCAVMDVTNECLRPELASGDMGFRTNNILFVERMQIAASHRGRECGLLLMLRLIRQFGADCGVVVIEPHPINHIAKEDDKEWRERMEWDQLKTSKAVGIRKLRKYWQQLGFKPVPGSKTHLYLDLDSEDLPDDVEIER